MSNPDTVLPENFIERIVENDLKQGHCQRIITRFSPEPNGYLHLGHIKSIHLNFTLAKKFAGECYLRFDDTNPGADYAQYSKQIQNDILWLGFQWAGPVRYASDYFQQLFDYAVELIQSGKAYVCSLSTEEIRKTRGDFNTEGQISPYAQRTVQENLDLFLRMKAGEFAEGAHVLRARIDMLSPNITLRDPILYRIRYVSHFRTGTDWSIYPMYDFAHPLSDAIEGITHSLCTLEFDEHRPLYNWCVEHVSVQHRPTQYEFAPLALSNTVLSKRYLRKLLDNQCIDSWDDPRMPTIAGLKRRGYPAAALLNFCHEVGVARANSVIDQQMFEAVTRQYLNEEAQRFMAVLRPIRLVITNYPTEAVEYLEVANHPTNPSFGTRQLPFTALLYIDRNDFRESAGRKFKRLVLGAEVRLRYAYVIRAEKIIRNDSGDIIEIQATYDKETLGQHPTDGRKVKGVIHWVSQQHAVEAQVRFYHHLFDQITNIESAEYVLNKNSLEVLDGVQVEAYAASLKEPCAIQFEREGYFIQDTSATGTPMRFNRVLPLRAHKDVQAMQFEE